MKRKSKDLHKGQEIAPAKQIANSADLFEKWSADELRKTRMLLEMMAQGRLGITH
jgi:hypothetical protein